MMLVGTHVPDEYRFSALQRAEIAEILIIAAPSFEIECFSALQRAEIAEICLVRAIGSEI